MESNSQIQSMSLNNKIAAFVFAVTILLFANIVTAEDTANGNPDKPETGGSRQFVAAPLIFSSPAFGNKLSTMAMYFYKPDAAGEKSPSKFLSND